MSFCKEVADSRLRAIQSRGNTVHWVIRIETYVGIEPRCDFFCFIPLSLGAKYEFEYIEIGLTIDLRFPVVFEAAQTDKMCSNM